MIGRKAFFKITYEYLHINNSLLAVREERGLRRERQMKMKCQESKVQARWRERERFYLLGSNGGGGWEVNVTVII